MLCEIGKKLLIVHGSMLMTCGAIALLLGIAIHMMDWVNTPSIPDNDGQLTFREYFRTDSYALGIWFGLLVMIDASVALLVAFKQHEKTVIAYAVLSVLTALGSVVAVGVCVVRCFRTRYESIYDPYLMLSCFESEQRNFTPCHNEIVSYSLQLTMLLFCIVPSLVLSFWGINLASNEFD